MIKKGEVFISRDSIFKQYIFEELNMFDFLEKIQRNDVVINYVEALEGVEQDMQTVNGMRMNLEELEKNFAYIMLVGKELSFAISATLNELPIRFMVNLNTNIVVTDTSDANLELESLIK